MNNNLLKKLLSKLSLEDLHSEIKNNNNALCELGLVIAKNRPAIFAKLVEAFVDEAIKYDDKELSEFLKTEILSLDESGDLSPNKIVKKKVAASPKPVVSSGGGCGGVRGDRFASNRC